MGNQSSVCCGEFRDEGCRVIDCEVEGKAQRRGIEGQNLKGMVTTPRETSAPISRVRAVGGQYRAFGSVASPRTVRQHNPESKTHRCTDCNLVMMKASLPQGNGDTFQCGNCGIQVNTQSPMCQPSHKMTVQGDHMSITSV